MRTLHLGLAVGLALLSNLGTAAGQQPRQSIAGDWAGWLYLKAGGDAPIRLHVEGEAATLDFPHAKFFRGPLTAFEFDGKRVVFERLNSSGQLQRFEGRVDGDRISGTAALGDSAADFQLHRSPHPLPTVEPEKYADCAGIYRFKSGRSLILTPRFWGELLALDSVTGQYVTLFPVSESRFFLGSAMYVPSPVTAWLECVRDKTGRIELTRREPGQETERGHRVELLDEPVEFHNGPTRFSGTLIRPAGQGPFPGVVLLGGSNWETRGAVRADADVLASFGLAVLTYDKRGFGESQGDSTVPFSLTAEDAAAAFRYLSGRKEVNSRQVGFFGRSRGGWLAPLAATLVEKPAFLVLFVAPAISPAQQETTRRLNVLKGQGVTEEQLGPARRYLELQFRFARTSEGWEDYRTARQEMEKRGWLDVLGGHDSQDPEEWKWARLNMHYDPTPALEKIQAPVLAVFGEKDNNVEPEVNLPLMRAALARAGNRDVRLVVAKGADHSLRLADPDENLLHLKRGYAPEVWRSVHDWLAARVKLNGAGR